MQVGNASETKETAVEKDETNNAGVATLEKTMETGAATASAVENSAVVVESPVSRVVDVRQDC